MVSQGRKTEARRGGERAFRFVELIHLLNHYFSYQFFDSFDPLINEALLARELSVPLHVVVINILLILKHTIKIKCSITPIMCFYPGKI